MRHRGAVLAGAAFGLCLVVGCTGGAGDPVGQDRVYGPQVPVSAPVWPGMTGVTIGDQPSMWWPVASARDLHPTGIEVVASSEDVGGMVVDGSGAVWVDVPWGLVRLDPGTWSATAWDAGDDEAFASKEFVRASSGTGVWLAGQDRVRLFDGIRIVHDIQVPAPYLGEFEGDPQVRDVAEVGSELWIASATGVARCDGQSWSAVGEGQLDDVGSLQLTPWGEVWAGSWGEGGLMRWTRDGSQWTPIDRPGYSDVNAIVPDPTGGIMAASGSEVLRYDGSDWQALLQLDVADGADVWADAIAASGDGTVWAIVGGWSVLPSLLRSDDEGHGHLIAAPDRTWPTAVAVAGDAVVVSTDTGVYRVAGDALERVWSPQQRGAVVEDQLLDALPVSGDEAWIVTEDWSAEGGPVQLWRVQVGGPDPVPVASLPQSAAQAYWGWPLPRSLGSAAVAASDGAVWYVTEEAVIRDADGTESVVASKAPEPLADAYVVNVNVVATEQGGPGRADPRPREIGPDAFAELTVPGRTIEQTLYGDGGITCPDHWAHDRSLPVGQVQYTPTAQGIEITVTLTKAWPDTEYYVEVNTDQFCQGQQDGTGDRRFGGLVTDGDGAGSLTLTLTYLPTSDYAARLPAVALQAGDAGSVWVLSTEPGWLEPGDRQPGEEASLEGLRLLAPDGGFTQVDLPAPARDIMLLAVGAGDHLWATVCEGGTEPGGWGMPACPTGWRLKRWEAGWRLVAYPGVDVWGLGAAPGGGFWAILADRTVPVEHGVLAHYRDGSWTTFPELSVADVLLSGLGGYAVTPAGSVCRIDDAGPTLICVDPTLQISRTPVGVTGKVAAAADGAVWVWGHQGLARVPITVP